MCHPPVFIERLKMIDVKERPAKVDRATKKKSAYVLMPKDLAMAEFVTPTMTITVPYGTPFESILKPEFWVNVRSKFARNAVSGQMEKSGSSIIVRTVDMAYHADLIVLAVVEGGMIVECVGPVHDKHGNGQPYYIGPRGDLSDDRHTVNWNNQKRGFDIIRKSDRQIVGQAVAIRTRSQVLDWLRNSKV